MSTYTIAAIEDAIIAKLAPLKTWSGGANGVRTIKSYRSELMDEESLARATRIFPALLVVYTGSDYEEHGARKIERMAYTIFVCDRNLREESEGRRGALEGPGVYALLDSVRDLLYDSRLGLDIFPMVVVRERPVWFGQGVTIYSAEYETAQALLYTGD